VGKKIGKIPIFPIKKLREIQIFEKIFEISTCIGKLTMRFSEITAIHVVFLKNVNF